MKTIESENSGRASEIRSALDGVHTSLGTAEMATMAGTSNTSDDSQIAAFYVGKSVFITGATGFMGKVLVEKLLRSCPGVKTIYVLLRGKRGVEPKNRLHELLNSKAFDRVREENVNQLSKVLAISGDITLPGLGISQSDLELLVRDVSVVFHSAATVKFDEPLRTSVNFNTRGTRHVLQTCHQMKKLQALVHVSTAYSNCHLPEVEETLYPPPAPPKRILELTEWMDDATLDSLTPWLLGRRPNTYTYTKALAEQLLVEEAAEQRGLPIAIVRPSIVTAAWREPFPGWVDNINGPTSLVVASGKGMLRTMLFDSAAVADLIPVDMVINLMVTVAWHTATTRPQGIPIYNCTSGTLNSIKWGDIERLVFPLNLHYPSLQVFRYPGGNFKESRILNNLCTFFDHMVPAYASDAMMRLLGKKPIMVRLYEKLHRATAALEWFTTRDWSFKSNNVVEMSQQLQGVDQKIFHFDVRDLQWEPYWRDYILGIRKFILKEDEESLPLARSKLKRVYYTQKFVSLLLLFGLWHLLLRLPLTSSLINGALSAAARLMGTVFGDGSAATAALTAASSQLLANSDLQASEQLLFNSSAAAASTATSPSSSFSSSFISAVAAIAGFPTTASSTSSSSNSN